MSTLDRDAHSLGFHNRSSFYLQDRTGVALALVIYQTFGLSLSHDAVRDPGFLYFFDSTRGTSMSTPYTLVDADFVTPSAVAPVRHYSRNFYLRRHPRCRTVVRHHP